MLLRQEKCWPHSDHPNCAVLAGGGGVRSKTNNANNPIFQPLNGISLLPLSDNDLLAFRSITDLSIMSSLV